MSRRYGNIKDAVRGVEIPEVREWDGVYYRTYRMAWQEELYAKMGAQLFMTLNAIAAFMDKEGISHASQSTLARFMGIKERQAHNRVKELLEFRDDDGNPVVIMEKARNGNSPCEKCVYKILPNSGLAIFEEKANKGKRPSSDNKQEIAPVEEITPTQKIASMKEVTPMQKVTPMKELLPMQELAPVNEVAPTQETAPLQGIKSTQEIATTQNDAPTQDIAPVPEDKPGLSYDPTPDEVLNYLRLTFNKNGLDVVLYPNAKTNCVHMINRYLQRFNGMYLQYMIDLIVEEYRNGNPRFEDLSLEQIGNRRMNFFQGAVEVLTGRGELTTELIIDYNKSRKLTP